MHTGQQLHTKVINFYPSQLCMALCISGLLQSDLSIWNKCKYIDYRNIIKFQVYLLFLAAGLLEGKAREKGQVTVYIFQQPIALSKTGRFQNNSDR